jgi:AcrR family transcriptional regulator
MQSRAQATRIAITTTAGAIFGRSGFTNASLNEIGQLAGTTTGAIYFHFDSKDKLAQAVLEKFNVEMRTFCDAILARGGSPLHAMMLASFGWGRRITTDPIIAGGVRLSIERPDLQAISNDAYDPWVSTTEILLSHARRAGEVSAGIEIDIATRYLIGNFIGAQIMSREFTDHADFEERLIDLWRYSLTGLLPRQTPYIVDQLVEAALLELDDPQLNLPRSVHPPASEYRRAVDADQARADSAP